MDDLIKTSEYVSLLTTPSRLELGDTNTFGRVLRNTATLYTARGERFPPGTTLDSKAQCKEFIVEAAKFIDRRASEQRKAKFGGMEEDIHTEPPIVDVSNYVTYDMEDLSFNLTPRRSCFLDPYRKALSDTTYQTIVEILDAKCSNGERCYYKTDVFPHVDSVGSVALSSWVGKIFTRQLLSCTNDQNIDDICELVYTALRPLAGVSSAMRVLNKCIVCTLINASAQRIGYNGAVFGRDDDERRDLDLFLLHKGHATAIGFKTQPNVDYSQDVFNIYDTSIYQLDDVLSINKRYNIKWIRDDWVVIRLSPTTDQTPKSSGGRGWRTNEDDNSCVDKDDCGKPNHLVQHVPSADKIGGRESVNKKKQVFLFEEYFIYFVWGLFCPHMRQYLKQKNARLHLAACDLFDTQRLRDEFFLFYFVCFWFFSHTSQ
jgi:hypothetical protein